MTGKHLHPTASTHCVNCLNRLHNELSAVAIIYPLKKLNQHCEMKLFEKGPIAQWYRGIEHKTADR